MVLDNTEQYKFVWEKVYTQLHFKPNALVRTHSFDANVPFQGQEIFAVYGIENMEDHHIDIMDNLIRDIFSDVVPPDERMYALDWQHSAFLYDPRNIEEQADVWVKDERCVDGGYTAYFPPFFPDGDYCFFIDEKFRFGYLGHPWRQEIWIFGEQFIDKFEEIYPKLGWKKLK